MVLFPCWRESRFSNVFSACYQFITGLNFVDSGSQDVGLGDLILYLLSNEFCQILSLIRIISLFLENNCSWCHQDISSQSTEIIGSQGTVFCSENCFLFWRRASFKRAKTCDYCKSVRNAVSYVDFSDGATQLQFCSDKCLNQYKMQIFCRETQAHLELNPHLKEKNDAGGKSSILRYKW